MDSTPTTTARPCFGARLCTELKRLVLLAVVVGLLAVAGKYYCFDRLDEEIRLRVETQLRTHYAGLSVSVRSARRVAGRGVEIRGVRIREGGGQGAPLLVEINEIFADCDTRLPDFITKPPQITSLHVHGLKLRAERKTTGFWNLATLLPLPPCQSSTPPAATISDGTFEIVDPTQSTEGHACSWSLRNIELTVQPQNAPPVPSEDVSIPVEGGAQLLLHVRGTLAGDHVEHVEIDGLLDPNSGQWRLKGAVEGLEFCPRLRAALPRELSTALAPLSSVRGRTHFGFEASRPPHDRSPQAPREGSRSHREPPAMLQFTIHGNISEGRIDDARLPEPLTDVEATIHCDNDGVQVDQLSARCGQTALELTAVCGGYPGSGPIDLRLAAKNVQLERLPTRALPPQVGETWTRFAPRGSADISGRLWFDGRQWQPDLTIECHDLSVAYDRFPYRVTDGKGTIRVQPGSATVRLRTMGGGQPIVCQAEVGNPGRDFTGWIEIHSEGALPIDEKALAAMDEPTRALVRSFHPRGSAAFAARFQRDPGEVIIQRRIGIQLHDCTLQQERFAYPIDKVSGWLEQIDGNWIFRNLAGRNDSAAIVGEGSWAETGPGGRQLVLHFAATDVPLADELRQALPPGPQRLWSNLRPRGNIDRLLIDLKYAAAVRQWSIDVRAEKWPLQENAEGRPMSLEPLWFPYRLDNLTGNFHYADGQMQFEKLHASHGPATIAAEGLCRVPTEGGCRLELTKLAADNVEADQDLLSAMPLGLRDTLGRFPVQGPLNVLGALGITVPASVEMPPQLDWDLSLVIVDGRVQTPTPVEHLHGGLRLVGRQSGEGVFSHGELGMDSAVVRGVQLTNVTGPFWIDGRRLVFGSLAERDAGGGAPRQITARLFGGLLTLDGELGLAPEGPFHLQTALENANLVEIARQLAPHHQRLSGRVYGQARLAGTSQGRHTWRGDGNVRLRDADIYTLPVMISLLKLLSIQPPDRTAFTTSNIDFRIQGDDVVLDRIDFSGDAISLKGKGWLNAQRQIDLKFYPLFGREEWHLPIFRPLVGETGRQFMLIEVTGTLDRQDVHRQVFPRLDDQLKQLFPELAREGPAERDLPILSLPREALNRLWQPGWR